MVTSFWLELIGEPFPHLLDFLGVVCELVCSWLHLVSFAFSQEAQENGSSGVCVELQRGYISLQRSCQDVLVPSGKLEGSSASGTAIKALKTAHRYTLEGSSQAREVFIYLPVLKKLDNCIFINEMWYQKQSLFFYRCMTKSSNEKSSVLYLTI